MKNCSAIFITLFLLSGTHAQSQNATVDSAKSSETRPREKAAEIAGWIATSLTIISALPNAISALRDPIAAQNRYHIVIQGPLLVVGASWMLYGLLADLLPVWLPNVFCSISIIIPWVWVKYKNRKPQLIEASV